MMSPTATFFSTTIPSSGARTSTRAQVFSFSGSRLPLRARIRSASSLTASDLAFRKPPHPQRPLGAGDGRQVGFHVALLLPQLGVRYRAFPRRIAHLGQLLLVEMKLREGIRQFALLFAQVLAPHDRQELLLADMVAERGGRERVACFPLRLRRYFGVPPRSITSPAKRL